MSSSHRLWSGRALNGRGATGQIAAKMREHFLTGASGNEVLYVLVPTELWRHEADMNIQCGIGAMSFCVSSHVESSGNRRLLDSALSYKNGLMYPCPI